MTGYVGHFGPRPAPRRDRPAGARGARGRAARRRAERAAAAGGAAAVLAGTGRRPRHRAQHRRRRLRPARRGGLARRTARVGHERRRPGAGRAGRRRAGRGGSRAPAPRPARRAARPRRRSRARPGSRPRGGRSTAAPFDALGYGDPRGRPELRLALAGYLARARGVVADPDRIVVCSGFTQGLALLCRALRARGAADGGRRGVRPPRAPRGRRRRGAGRRAGCPWTRSAPRSTQLGDADAALLTPAHQFPLGVALAPGAARPPPSPGPSAPAALVIEDDYDGEFRYDRQPVGAMQALAPEHVVYAGTASKTLAPGVRLGWLVLPADLVDDVVAVKALVRPPEQRARPADARRAHRERRLRPPHPPLAARLPAPARPARRGPAPRRARRAGHRGRRRPARRRRASRPAAGRTRSSRARPARGLAVEGLGAFAAAESREDPALIVGYGAPAEHAFTAAVARLTAALAE